VQQRSGHHPLFQGDSLQSVEIKAIDPYDFDIWLPLWKGYQRFYEVDFFFSVALQARHGSWTLGADARSACHGWRTSIRAGAFDLPSIQLGDGPQRYRQDLFIADDTRGGGIGRALIEHVYADAKRRGVFRVHWLTHGTNHNDMQLYDRIADRSPFIQYRKLFA
jgi:GNAT superfamily N-acetyltransferase